jgi:uncharacterized membrane protein YccF (DUF307 family)
MRIETYQAYKIANLVLGIVIGLALSVILWSVAGCASVSSIPYKNCEFAVARPDNYPWGPQICLTTCVDGQTISRFPGCSSESGVLSGLKAATGLVPTVPVPVK